MLATTSSNLRENQKHYFDRVVQDCETLIVTRRDDENVVVIAQSEWESLQETLHLMSTRANREHLARSMAQADAGLLTTHELAYD